MLQEIDRWILYWLESCFSSKVKLRLGGQNSYGKQKYPPVLVGGHFAIEKDITVRMANAENGVMSFIFIIFLHMPLNSE